MVSWVCQGLVCNFAGILYTQGSEVWIYILFGPCFIMQPWGCDGHLSERFLAGLAETSRNVTWHGMWPPCLNQLRCFFFFRWPGTFGGMTIIENGPGLALRLVCACVWRFGIKLFGSKTARATKETNLCLWASGRHIEVESGTLRNTKNAKAIDWPWFVADEAGLVYVVQISCVYTYIYTVYTYTYKLLRLYTV